MRGDFSVWRFDPNNNDQGVLFEQGRVILDSDLTDAERLALHWRLQAARDVIGARVAAVPAGEPDGFFIESAAVVGGDVHLQIRPGRVWADGVLLYLPPDPADPTATIDRVAVPYGAPLNPAPLPPIGDGVRDVVVLEVALQELNAFQEPLRLLEPALGGPDTTERINASYGFRLFRLDPGEDCTTILPQLEDGPAGKGRLTVTLDPPIAVGGDCPTVEGGGYTGFEHNLYRIEIAAVNSGAARFKWSQFNGGLVGRGTFIAGAPNRVVIDANRAAILNSGLTDFYLEAVQFNTELGRWEVTYGALASLNVAQDLELTSPPIFGTFSFGTDPVFFRLWNGIELISDYTNTTDPAELLDGIHLAFDLPATSLYRAEDYWMFSVRAGEITNPETLVDDEAPHGIIYRRVPLAEINWTAAQDTTEGGLIEDCRKRFRPLTNQRVCCSLLIGDGINSFGDFNSLEEAALHLPASGGDLCLLPGLHFANLALVGQVNIRIVGCARRTLVLPRLQAPGDPIITLVDCAGIEVTGLDLASFFGPIIVAEGTAFDQQRDLRITDCRMLARTYGVQIRRAEQVTVTRNQIWVLDTVQGRAAIQLRVHQGLVERNAIGVWPFELTPPNGGGDGETPPNPSDPCADPADVYGNLTYTVHWILFVWATNLTAAPVQPYLAWGGIHLLGGCEDIRVLQNRVDGGAGHGITLGGLLPGEPATPSSGDPANPPTVNVPQAAFIGSVINELNQPVPGVDVSLRQGSVIEGQGTSTGPQAVVEIKVDPGTYIVEVEPGFEIVSISTVDTGALRLHILVVRTVPVVVAEEQAFLYQIAIRENDILRMALSGIGFNLFTLEMPPAPPLDLTDPAEIAAAFATLFAPRVLLGTSNIVRDLTITENRIHENLRVVFTPALRTAARQVGQGGISLGLVENGRISGNQVYGNVTSAVEPVCGIFVGYAENLDICDNELSGNGAITENYEADKVEGLRGGIYVRFASAFLVGGESDTQQKPAVRIRGNRIDQPAGRALTVFAFGPVACDGNYMNSERTGRFNVLDLVVGGVLILNIGGLHRQQRFTNDDDSLLSELLLPGGEVLFNNNQVRLGTAHRSLSTTFIITMDDLGFDANQSSVFRPELLFTNAFCMGFSVRATDGRFREHTAICFFSLLTYSFGMTAAGRLRTMNITAHNQGDHCIHAMTNAPWPPAPPPPPYGPPVVFTGNIEANFAECRAALGDSTGTGASNGQITAGLVATLFGTQTGSFNTVHYQALAGTAATNAANSILVSSYQYRQAYMKEAAYVGQNYGADHPRTLQLRTQLQQSNTKLQQFGVQTELTTITEPTAPENGTLFDGRVVDGTKRGRADVVVDLVRADGSLVGVSARTDKAGYFSVELDARQATALATEKQLFVRVTDDKGTVLHRDKTPLSFANKAPVRTTVLVERAEVPRATLNTGTVVFDRPRTPAASGPTPLENVKGIGPRTAARLRAAGIADLETLLHTPGDRLVQIAGFDADVIRKAAQSASSTVTPRPAEPVLRREAAATPAEAPAAEEPAAKEKKRDQKAARKRKKRE